MSAKESRNPIPLRQEQSDLLNEWIDRHSNLLLNYSRKYFPNTDIAEELVQETFLAAVESLDQFKAKSSPQTWLVGILRHKIFDRIRKKTKEHDLREQAEHQKAIDRFFDSSGHWSQSARPEDWKVTPDEVVQNRQFLAALEACLAKLPQKFKEVFLLRELEEWTRGEIAQKLGLSDNHVGVLLYRCRTELQNCLQTNWLSGKYGGAG